MMRNTGYPRRQTASAEKRRAGQIIHYFAVMFSTSLFPFLATADSGIIRTQENQGPFTITIFTPAEVSRGLPADITVMVQSRDSGEAVMDADVELGFVPPVRARFKPNDLVCGLGNPPAG